MSEPNSDASDRRYSLFDQMIFEADRALRTVAAAPSSGSSPARRATPQPKETTKASLNDKERKHAAGLMRVNHTGEVCAQALYQGQALTAKLPKVRDKMDQAAQEELDHLHWCAERVEDLGGRTSLLNPLFYGVSFGLGATAGWISDKTSLGFVAATEELVCAHLEDHLTELPENDLASRAVVEQMITEERHHGDQALQAGGAELPAPVKFGMRLVSKLMTKSSYYI